MGWGARFAGVVIACGGAGPEGQALPAATAEPSSDPSPTVSASNALNTAEPTAGPTPSSTSTTRTVAEEHSAKGAGAFVRHWIEEANSAFRTGEVRDWRALGATSCKTCAARIKAVEKAYGNGGRIEGGQLTIVDLLPSPLRKGDTPLVVADLKASEEKHYDSDGKLLDSFPAERTKLVFLMVWLGDHWSVSEIKLGVE